MPYINKNTEITLLGTFPVEKRNFLEDHPMKITTKFGFNWHSGLGYQNSKSL